jgi:pteridine reductase
MILIRCPSRFLGKSVASCYYNAGVIPSIPKPAATPLTALITGSAKRVGAQVVQRLHAQGYDVAIHYRRSVAEATTLVARLNAIRANSAVCFGADLSSKAGCDELAAQFSRWRGSLHLLINNASVFERTPFGQVTEAQWQQQIDGNAKAAFFVTQACLPLLRGAAKANIINICDARWDKPMAGFSAYAVAKAGMVALTRCLSLELAPLIRVNAIGPGSLDWPEDETFSVEQKQSLEVNIPLNRIGSGDDIADTVLFLCKVDSYVNGQIINVDGGSSAISG